MSTSTIFRYVCRKDPNFLPPFPVHQDHDDVLPDTMSCCWLISVSQFGRKNCLNDLWLSGRSKGVEVRPENNLFLSLRRGDAPQFCCPVRGSSGWLKTISSSCGISGVFPISPPASVTMYFRSKTLVLLEFISPLQCRWDRQG